MEYNPICITLYFRNFLKKLYTIYVGTLNLETEGAYFKLRENDKCMDLRAINNAEFEKLSDSSF
jgi:hypothetical protein